MFDDWLERFTPPLRRVVDPPRAVLVDLGQAIPTHAPNGFGRNEVAMRIKAGGLNISGTVPAYCEAGYVPPTAAGSGSANSPSRPATGRAASP